MVMSLKNLFTTSYSEKTYKHTVDLQKMKVKASIAKKELIFLERCIKNNILSKSFHLKPPIKSIKGYNIMKDCSQQEIGSACEKQCKAKNVFHLEKGRRN